MPDGSLWTMLIMLICLVFSAFFSSSETAFTSFNKTKMKNAASEGDKKAALVLQLNDRYDTLLSTLLVGNNIVNILLSSVATVWFLQLLAGSSAESSASVISTAVVTVVVLIFGEITPKSLAKDHAESFARFTAPILRVFMVILFPINCLFMLWKKLLNGIFKAKEEDTVTEGEVLTLLDEAHEDGSIDEYNKELIENVFEFDDITVGEIATHRTGLTMLCIDDTDEEWEQVINGSRYSRYPVYGETVDDILGVLNAKDYFRLESRDRETVLKKAVYPAYFVPETITADKLFHNMKEKKESLAIVLDEYGGTRGVVTITDLIECLLGEITDATDEDANAAEEEILATGENAWSISGTALLSDVEEALGVELDDVDTDTFSGYVLGLHGAIPDDGSSFDVTTERLQIHIDSIKEHKIEKASVYLLTQEDKEV